MFNLTSLIDCGIRTPFSEGMRGYLYVKTGSEEMVGASGFEPPTSRSRITGAP